MATNRDYVEPTENDWQAVTEALRYFEDAVIQGLVEDGANSRGKLRLAFGLSTGTQFSLTVRMVPEAD